jgi:hypothetical protein
MNTGKCFSPSDQLKVFELAEDRPEEDHQNNDELPGDRCSNDEVRTVMLEAR